MMYADAIRYHFYFGWRSYYNADDFCGSWFSENYIENALSHEGCFFDFVFKTLADDQSWLRAQ